MNDSLSGLIAGAIEPKMAKIELEQLMWHALRHRGVFDVARSQLSPSYFTGEPQYELLWRSFLGLVEKYGFDGVTEAALHIAVARELDEDPFASPEIRNELLDPKLGVIHWAFKEVDFKDLKLELGLDYLKAFLRERAVGVPLRDVVQAAGDDHPAKLTQFVNELAGKAVAIDALGRSVRYEVVPDDFRPTPVKVFTTGTVFFDAVMAGGHAPGEIYALMALFGGGKTTLAVQLAVAAAIHFRAQAAAGGPMKHVYFFTYEEIKELIRNRVIACAASISKSRLDSTIESNADFSRRGALLEYERDLYVKKGVTDPAQMLGEWERLQGLRGTINKNLQIMDMTERGVGDGGVAEIASILAREQADGREPGLVIIDYISEVVDRDCMRQGTPATDLQKVSGQAILRAINDLRLTVTIPFSVPLWLMHQYNGESQKRQVGAVLQMSDSSLTKSLARNLNFCFCMGPVDPETKCCTLHVAKARRAGTDGQVKLIRRDGDMGRFHDADKDFTLDRAVGKIVSRDSLRELAAVEPDENPTPRRRSGNVYDQGKPTVAYHRLVE